MFNRRRAMLINTGTTLLIVLFGGASGRSEHVYSVTLTLHCVPFCPLLPLESKGQPRKKSQMSDIRVVTPADFEFVNKQFSSWARQIGIIILV